MKEQYVLPSIEIITISQEDVICTSGCPTETCSDGNCPWDV